MQIGASVLSADFSNLKVDLYDMQKAGVDFWHLDIMDGYFVPNFTFGVDIINVVPSNLPLQIHLMVENPEKIYEIFKSNLSIKHAKCEFIFHVENKENTDLFKLISQVKADGYRVGLAINPSTIVSELDPYLKLIDTVLIMSVNPGFSGQKFISGVLSKIEYIKSIQNDMKIGLDGGVNDQTVNSVNLKNIDFLVSGSYLFSSDKRSEAVLSLK
jgi:ribulose-phosphate 3-epimerase